MFFFSRLRASASTWSFQRCVVHSGVPRVAVEPDPAVLRLACDDSIGPRSLEFRPWLCTALALDMPYLRSFVGGAIIETAMSELRRTFGCHATHASSMPQPGGRAYGCLPAFVPVRHPIPCEGAHARSGVVLGDSETFAWGSNRRLRLPDRLAAQYSFRCSPIPIPSRSWPPEGDSSSACLTPLPRLRIGWSTLTRPADWASDTSSTSSPRCASSQPSLTPVRR
jgi:hypothetical protein